MASIPPSHISATMIRASSGSVGKPNQEPKKGVSSSWWAPLSGMSADPDYICPGSLKNRDSEPEKLEMSGSDRSSNRFVLGGFTEEKARQLRRKTAEGASFHDVMYHSAIASRLASDASGQAEK